MTASAVDLSRAERLAGEPELVELARHAQFSPRRGYARLGIDRSSEEPARLDTALGAPEAIAVTATHASHVIGVLVVAPDQATTDHFGTRCWSTRSLAIDPSAPRAQIVRQLLEPLASSAIQLGIDHLSARLATEDFEGLDALQSVGFRVCDTMATWAVIPRDPNSEVIRWRQIGDVDVTYAYGPEILEFDPSTGPQMAAILAEHYTLSRFHADPTFDPAAASRWYARWCERAFRAEGVDGMMLAVHEGAPVGFICWDRDKFSEEHSGHRIYGGGLGASLGFGAYSSMVDFAELSPTFDVAEFDVHICNTPVNRVLGRHPAAHSLNVSHALHLRLGR